LGFVLGRSRNGRGSRVPEVHAAQGKHLPEPPFCPTRPRGGIAG